jgi:hypothetical protein
MSTSELVSQLMSSSAVRRLEVQRVLLAKSETGSAKLLISLIKDSGLSIESRIAAIFTLSQMKGMTADQFLQTFAKDWNDLKEIQQYLTRAAGDLSGEISGDSLSLVEAALQSGDERTRLQAVVFLMRIINPSKNATAQILKVVAEAQDLRIQNTAVGALVKIGDVESLLSHVNKRTARLALMRLHQPEVISGIAASLQQSQGSERMGLIEILARLFYR